jgi:hypothetical protein
MAGFSELATSLCAPILGILIVKKPIVSGRHLKNSRFGRPRLETGFDLHCVTGLTVQTHEFLRMIVGKFGVPPVMWPACHLVVVAPGFDAPLIPTGRTFIRANASFARSRLDFRTAILSFRMSSRSVTPCSTMASRRLCGPSAAAHRDPLIGHDHMVERDFPHTFATGRILRRPILGGLHHQYVRI